MHFYNNILAINLCRLALDGQTVKNLRLLASKFEVDQSQRKSTQVGVQRKRKLNDLRVRLARALGFRFGLVYSAGHKYRYLMFLVVPLVT